MRENFLYITLGEVSLVFGALTEHITIQGIGDAFVYAFVAATAALIPKMIYAAVLSFKKRFTDNP